MKIKRANGTTGSGGHLRFCRHLRLYPNLPCSCLIKENKALQAIDVTTYRAGLSIILCRDLGRAIFGDRWGVWAIAPFQWSVLIGLAITYTATAGQSLQVRPSIHKPGLQAWMSMHASPKLPHPIRATAVKALVLT